MLTFIREIYASVRIYNRYQQPYERPCKHQTTVRNDQTSQRFDKIKRGASQPHKASAFAPHLILPQPQTTTYWTTIEF